MTERKVPLLRISPLDSAGCNAKLRARDLLALISANASEIGSLASDSSPTSRSGNLLFTVDTILPVTRDPINFGRIGVCHALNDLYAEGARAEDVCISYGFDTAAVEDGCAKQIVAGAESLVKQLGAKLAKAHSFLSSDVSISIAALGSRNIARPIASSDSDYVIVLTKPLGAAMGCFLGEIQGDSALVRESELVMLQGHDNVVDIINEDCVDGTTDVTGFGLIGHLACLAVRQGLEIDLEEASVPILAALSRTANASNLRNCSAVRNREDFRGFWERKNKAQDLTDLILFSGETSGPIACVVQKSKAAEFTRKLTGLGFSTARQIASVRRAKYGRVIIR